MWKKYGCLGEQFLEDSNGVLRTLDRVARDLWMGIDLVVIASLEGLITKEMDFLETFLADVTETVSLIPASGEHIEGDLATDRVSEVQVGEGILKVLDKLATQTTLQVELFEFATLSVSAVTANGRHVNHAVAELNKGTTAKQTSI